MIDPIFIPLIFPTPEFINLSYSPKNIPILKGKGIFDNGATNNEIPEATVNEQGIRLEFAQFGHFTSFDVIRSMVSMVGIADVDLPTPITTGVKTMYYVDSNVVEHGVYYYKVRVHRGAYSFVSAEIKCIASVADPYFATVSARLRFNGNLNDDTGRVWTPVNNPTISQNGVFGGCLDLTTGGYLYCAPSDALLLDGDFTIDFWMYALASSNPADNLIITSNKTGSWSYGVAAVNFFRDIKKAMMYDYVGGNYSVDDVQTEVWTRITFCRKDWVLRTFKNGKLSNIYPSITKIFPFNTNGTYIGRDTWNNTGVYDFKGYLDDLRISKGTAYYTEDFSVDKELPYH